MWFRVWSTRVKAVLLAIALAMTSPAFANLITFDFDSMGYRSSATPGSNTAVCTYLNGVWSAAGQAGSGSVSGAGELSNNQYTGDGHVVGPTTSTVTCLHYDRLHHCTASKITTTTTPATLGNTEGGDQGTASVDPLSTQDPDNYIVNAGSDRITITFPAPIYALSFDFEIFPDGTCPSSTHCGRNGANLPDFSLWVDNAMQWQVFGTYPGASNTYSHSPASGAGSTEQAPQYLSHAGLIVFDQGATQVSFVDWPQRIGIDNLVVDTQCEYLSCPRHDAPEPPTLPLTVGAFAALAWCVRSRRPGRRTSTEVVHDPLNGN
jgi:hypothetical protein